MDVYLKLESLQPGGSFNFRGANNAPHDLEAVLVPMGGGGLISGFDHEKRPHTAPFQS